MLKKTIFSKVFSLIMLASFITGVVILGMILVERTRSVETGLIRENKLLAEIVSKMVETGYLGVQLPFQTMKAVSDLEDILFLWIVKSSGEIYYADNPKMFGSFVEPPFFSRTGKEIVQDIILPFEEGKKAKLIIHPLEMELGEKPWGLYLGISTKPIDAARRQILLVGVYTFVFMLVLVGFISFYFSKKVSRPLEQLRKGAELLGKGQLEYRIEIKTGDEMEELGKAFNQMAKSLSQSRTALEESKAGLEIKVKARTKELEEMAEGLEDKVKERTKELQERIEELERFHKLTVGRELKMVELKEALQQAREGLEKLKEQSKGQKKT